MPSLEFLAHTVVKGIKIDYLAQCQLVTLRHTLMYLHLHYSSFGLVYIRVKNTYTCIVQCVPHELFNCALIGYLGMWKCQIKLFTLHASEMPKTADSVCIWHLLAFSLPHQHYTATENRPLLVLSQAQYKSIAMPTWRIASTSTWGFIDSYFFDTAVVNACVTQGRSQLCAEGAKNIYFYLEQFVSYRILYLY